MTYRICKTIEIENAHILSKHSGNCKFPHGHSRKIEMILESKQLNENDMVVDFKVIKDIILDFLNGLDHAMCVNTNDPHYDTLKKCYGDHIIDFKGQDPTTEVLARMIFDVLNNHLGAYIKAQDTIYPVADGVKVARVRLWETSDSWAEYSE